MKDISKKIDFSPYEKFVRFWWLFAFPIYFSIPLIVGFIGYNYGEAVPWAWAVMGFSLTLLAMPYIWNFVTNIIGSFLPKTIMVTDSIIIDAPIEIVWDMLTDYKNRAEWYDVITRTEKASDEPEKWRIWFCRKDVKGYKESLSELEVTKSNKPLQLTTYECVKDELLDFTYITDMYLKDIGSNKTELKNIDQITENKPAPRIAMNLFGGAKYALKLAHGKYKQRAENLYINKI